MAVHLVEDGTDVAIMGLWDLGLEPVAERHSLAELEQDVAAARLTLVHTGSDGSFDALVTVDEELPGEHGIPMQPIGGPFLLHVPTGRLCWGSTEFFRTKKPHDVAERQLLTVEPGDYAVRWLEVVNQPRLEFEQFLGKERYALWLAIERQTQMTGCILAVATAVALKVGWSHGVWIGLAIFAAGAAFIVAQIWLRDRREPERVVLCILEYEFAQRTGHTQFSDVEEAYLEGKPQFGLELFRQPSGTNDLAGGSVSVD